MFYGKSLTTYRMTDATGEVVTVEIPDEFMELVRLYARGVEATPACATDRPSWKRRCAPRRDGIRSST